MVDLLSRVGLLEDAKRTIDQMPIHPDALIWQILLSAYNIHGDVVLGNVAARKLLELQPKMNLLIFFCQISMLLLVCRVMLEN